LCGVGRNAHYDLLPYISLSSHPLTLIKRPHQPNPPAIPPHPTCHPQPLNQALHGTVFDCHEGIPPAHANATILSALNLKRLGPLACPRLWAALHDAVLYSDPRAAIGGKVPSSGWD